MAGVAPEPAPLAIARVLAGGLAGPPACPACLNEGIVCENHPDRPWEGTAAPPVGCGCGCGAGMPCPACCDPVPTDGTGSITDAFVPRHLRT
jgi:hypothetical protein